MAASFRSSSSMVPARDSQGREAEHNFFSFFFFSLALQNAAVEP